MRLGPGRGFLAGFTRGSGMLKSTARSSFTLSGLLVVLSHDPRTECHPSFSACSGRLPSPACNPSALLSSKSHAGGRYVVSRYVGDVLLLGVKKKANGN